MTNTKLIGLDGRLYFECIEGYATDENLVVAQGDILLFIGSEEGILYFEGTAGWCKGIEINFIPKIVAKHFKSVVTKTGGV